MPDDAEGELRIAAGRQAKVVVKGWRGSWLKFGADPDASGEGWLSAGGNLGVIRKGQTVPAFEQAVFSLPLRTLTLRRDFVMRAR